MWIGRADFAERRMRLLRVLIAIGAEAPVQVPAAHQRAWPQQAQKFQLFLYRRHLAVQAQAERGAGRAQHVGKGRHQQLRVAHFHGDDDLRMLVQLRPHAVQQRAQPREQFGRPGQPVP